MTGTDDRWAQDDLIERLRDHLADQPNLSERSMFGGRVFMVDERIVVSAGREGDLLVRVDPARSDELLARPGAHQAEMGPGRSMGPGWLSVSPNAIADEAVLADWVAIGLHRARTTPDSKR